ncbi:Transcriptional regulator PadR-like family protein [Micromonospora sp. MW-13]|uniref:PadR family transcriptional regulator n=1 Tax=Micromonospora sp. MW-13 TaxID=2094022 RepID=UPI000EDDA3FD|nr:Transcriptional regulator PadR-like family protein [Micromonospora sp. MW-13]
MSGGRVKTKAGTLYAALDRLSTEGLIVVGRKEAVGGRLRRYYVLSDDGRAALEAAVERLQSNAQVATSRLREAFGFIGGVRHA